VQRQSTYSELIAAMLRTGLLGYGGGPSVMPLFRHEAVQRYKWMKDEEFAEVLAFANALPGPIATKMAAYLGYRQLGTCGAITAVLAHILPTCLAMIGLLSVLAILKSSNIVLGMISGVAPVIAVLLAVMTYEFAKKAWEGLGAALALAFGAIAFVLLVVLQWNSGLVIVFFLAYGCVHVSLIQRLRNGREKRQGEGSD